MIKNAFCKPHVLLLTLSALLLSFHLLSAQDQDLKAAIGTLRDSVNIMRLQIDSLKLQAPGLGDYMTTIQLHIAKLWYAFSAANWELANYEVNELNETIDGAKSLHAMKNNVNTAGVLQSVQDTQVLSMHNAISSRDHQLFSAAYHETIDACNGCHKSAGYGCISVAMPTAPPVSNQNWNVH